MTRWCVLLVWLWLPACVPFLRHNLWCNPPTATASSSLSTNIKHDNTHYPCSYFHARSPCVSNSRLFGHNDGKKKKKKSSDSSSSASSPSSSPASSSSSSAPRVMRKEGGISVRQQIAMVKAYKASVEQPGKVSVPKKFRKEKADKPEQEEYVEVEYEEMKPPLVFVDGYNVIGYLRATGDNPAMRDFSEARDVLISDLAVLAGTTGWLIEVVFDAYKVKMPQKTEDYDGIRITYTSATETADSYIERRFFELHKEGFKNMLLCSDDILLRTVASEGLGYMPVSLLAEEIRIAYLQWEYFEQQMIAQSKRASDNFRIFPEELVNELKALMIEGQKRRALEAEAAAALVAANNATMATNGTIAGHVEGSNSSSLAVNITDSGNKTTTFIGKKGKERKKYITLPFYNQKITPAEAKLAKNIVVFEGLL